MGLGVSIVLPRIYRIVVFDHIPIGHRPLLRVADLAGYPDWSRDTKFANTHSEEYSDSLRHEVGPSAFLVSNDISLPGEFPWGLERSSTSIPGVRRIWEVLRELFTLGVGL